MDIQVEIAGYKTMEEFAAVFSPKPVVTPAKKLFTVLFRSSVDGELVTDCLGAVDYTEAFAEAERRYGWLDHLTILGISEGLKEIQGASMNTREKLLAEYAANDRKGKQETLPLFVYGTLLSGFGNHRLLAGNRCALLGSATVKGFELHGFPIPCAQFSSLSQAEVVGELYAFPAEEYQDILKVVDRLESEGNWYSRLRVTVQHAGQSVEAWMYVVAKEQQTSGGAPYFDYRAMDQASKFISQRMLDVTGREEYDLNKEDYR
jgi:gamma-glutamylcyclotransferase (GGCT)/AIG2-like uncharacterized protein YtfP